MGTCWWQESVNKVCHILATDAVTGLTPDQIEQKRHVYGHNELAPARSLSLVRLFVKELTSALSLMLFGAAFIALLLGQIGDAVTIFVIEIANACIGFVQGYRAQKTLCALSQFIEPTVRVMRAGVVGSVPSRDLVPGDIVLLEAGDVVPADGRIISAIELAMQESVLTGEPHPMHKTAEQQPNNNYALGDRLNMAFMGTSVVNGKGRIVITAIGHATEFGKIHVLLNQTATHPTPLEHKLTTLVHGLTGICLCFVVLIFVLGIVKGIPYVSMLLIAISLAVAVIPEGLPVATTLALAQGAQRMVRRNAIIRHLPAVETLSGVSVICSDKTGTLTKNEMTIRELWTSAGLTLVSGEGYVPQGTFARGVQTIKPSDDPDLQWALTIGSACTQASLEYSNDQWRIKGDPTDGACIVVAEKAGITRALLSQLYQLHHEIPFDQRQRLMGTVHSDKEGRRWILVKGAVEAVLDRSTHWQCHGAVEPLMPEKKALLQAQADTLGKKALRVIAFAYRPLAGDEVYDQHLLDHALIFVGLAGMEDPIRPEVYRALAQCKKAGIKMIMITGDHPETALAIGKQLGLATNTGNMLSGHDLAGLSESEFLTILPRIAIYARTSGEDKMRIVQAWQSCGALVAMTGDGINDAPAIKAADMGIAMGKMGTAVAREASDMVLLDDNFASLVAAIEQARGVYDGIRKFAAYVLLTAVAEIIVVLWGVMTCASHAVLTLPLAPIHLLWLDLVSEAFMVVALMFDPIASRAMRRPPRAYQGALLPFSYTVLPISLGCLVATGALLLPYLTGAGTTLGIQTCIFSALVIFELVGIELVRVRFGVRLGANYTLIIAGLVLVGIQGALVYISPLQTVFHTHAVPVDAWWAVGAVIGGIVLLGWGLVLLSRNKYVIS